MSDELPIPPAVNASKKSMEMVRVWIADGAQHVCLTPNLWKDPAAWGLFLVDLSKHVAGAYQAQGHDYADALRRIKAGFDTEWSHQTDEPTGGPLS